MGCFPSAFGLSPLCLDLIIKVNFLRFDLWLPLSIHTLPFLVLLFFFFSKWPLILSQASGIPPWYLFLQCSNMPACYDSTLYTETVLGSLIPRCFSCLTSFFLFRVYGPFKMSSKNQLWRLLSHYIFNIAPILFFLFPPGTQIKCKQDLITESSVSFFSPFCIPPPHTFFLHISVWIFSFDLFSSLRNLPSSVSNLL